MRKIGYLLLAVVLLLAIGRAWTGIVYRADVPVAVLVLKRVPSLAIERTETAAQPLDRDVILDEEEPQLVYGEAYLWGMQNGPVLMLVMLACAAVLLLRKGRRT